MLYFRKDRETERLTILHSVQWLSDSKSLVMTWADRYSVKSTTQMCTVSRNSCKDNVAPLPESEKNGKWLPNLVNSKSMRLLIISVS